MNLKINLPPKVKSRKVNKYVELSMVLKVLQKTQTMVEHERAELLATMTGGQIGEAQRILTT